MLDGAKIAVIVPAFNEERLLGRTLSRMPGFVDLVVVVDDASRDATSRVAEAVGDPRTVVLRHETNQGVGAAIVTGYTWARSSGADVMAVMAGDGQMHPDDLAPLLGPVLRGEADYAKGTRFRHPDIRRTMPPLRFHVGRLLALLTRWAAGLDRLSDSQCGYTAISARAIDALGTRLRTLWPRYGYPNDLLGLLREARLSIAEVDVRPIYADEKSGLRPWHVLRILALIVAIAWRRRVPVLEENAASTASS